MGCFKLTYSDVDTRLRPYWRMYDPQIGRWNVIDPAGEYFDAFSPYSYTFNNPVFWADYCGLWPEDPSFSKYFPDLLYGGHGDAGPIWGKAGGPDIAFGNSSSTSSLSSIGIMLLLQWAWAYPEEQKIPIEEGPSGQGDGDISCTPNFTDRIGVLDYAGYQVDGFEYAAKLTAKSTYKYGTRTLSAAKMTAEGVKTFGKLASRLNLLGAGLGTIDCTMQGFSDYRNGNRWLATFEFSKAIAYTGGVILIAVSPFTAGSTAVIGGYIIAGTSAVDVAGDVSLPFYGRNR